MNISQKSSKIFYLSHILLPLLIGGLTYLIFRPKNLFFFEVMELISDFEMLNKIRVEFVSLKSQLPNWMIYSLPNSLWLYSMLSFWLYLWHEDEKRLRMLITLSFSFCALIEVFQHYQLIPGTYCLEDLVLILVTTIVFCLIHLQILKSK